LQKKDDFKKGNENNKAKNNQEEIIEKKEKGINTDNKEKKEGYNKNDDINEKNKEANNKGKKNDTNEKEQSENKDNKDNKERNNINDNENNDINNKNKLDKIENKKKIEKKLNQFKLVLSIMLSVKNISTDKLENKLLKYKDLSNENLENNKDDKKAFFLNISKDILEVINIKNENDIKLLRKILNYLFEEKYQKNKEIFLNKAINDLVGKNKLTFKENEDEEHKLLGKVIQEYSVKSNEIVEKIKKDNKKILSYKNLKKYLKEEQLYIKNNKEKIELFKFFIYVLKKNSSLHDDNFSIFDFASEDIISFFSNILDIANDKIYEDSIANDGLSITDEDYKKIISNFVKDFNKLLKEKNMRIEQLLGEDNINMIVKEGKEINLINIYTFIDKLREKGLQLNDNLVISCIFARYQLDENQEDIDLNLLENDLQQISI
jgi:CCR4-NOT transcription complex subunit 6